MARTRGQSAQQGRVLSASKPQGTPLRSSRNAPEVYDVANWEQEANLVVSESTQQVDGGQVTTVHATPDNHGTKRPADTHHDPDSVRKRPRQQYPPDPLVEETSERLDPVGIWARDGHWPQEYSEPGIERLLPRKKSFPSSASSTTPSDQQPREVKSAQYNDPRYEVLLQIKGTYLDTSDLDITDASKRLIQDLLHSTQPIPGNTIFDDTTFLDACRNLPSKNEARVIQDISRLIVPSAETLALRKKDLGCLAESVNEGWNNSIPLTGTRPQPDYSVGFRREAFTDDQLAKLSPFIGDFITGDQSLFMATYYMYFPFLTCEVNCGTIGLDVADRQNAHSTTLAVRAIVELFRAVERQSEVNRQILAFSISHDHRSVRIYGHYAVIGETIKYYRHPIRAFDFTGLDGKDKWTAYQFTMNVYERWMPTHFERICSAIDQLPSEPFFDVLSSQSETELSQDLVA
ncbi:hypothetical protein ACRALDRAFT_1074238 [Sodiomyces alcalophilus JCM 7366]|uniref:uncharacterized protein n=1 Tax=Sodiomyces alcalophilus JCM 7366 TaxID=591952 RepID=UPI0039B5219A